MKLIKYFLYLLFVLIWVSLFSGLAAADQKGETDTFTEKHQLIFKKIDLEKDQAAKIQQLLEGYNLQAKIERQESANNVGALIDKARVRREKLETDIKSLLTGDQKEIFNSIFTFDPLEKELFSLKEGLILDPLQTNTVEYILMKLQEEYNRKMPRQMGVKGTSISEPNRRAGKSWNSRRYRYIGSMIRQREAKKAREIKKILTKDQLKRHKEYQKIRKKQIKDMLQRLKTG